MRGRSGLLHGLFVAGILTVSLACGGGASVPTSTRAPAQPTAATQPTPTSVPTATTVRSTPTAAPQVAAKPSGRAVVAIPDLADESFDATKFYAGQQLHAQLALNDALVVRDQNAAMSPAIATSWEAKDDGWTFNLRKGVKFHNGDTVTTKDIEFAFQRMLDPKSKNHLSGELRRAVDRLDVQEDRIVFHTPKPWGLMLNYAWGIIPENKKYHETVGEDEFSKKWIGAGPFRLADYSRQQYVEMEAFEGFYQPSRVPKTKTVTYRLIPDAATRVAMLKTGEADMIGVTPSQAREVSATANLRVIAQQNALNGHLVVNDLAFPESSPLKDKRVRLALLLAIDRETISQKVFFGYGRPATTAFFPSTFGVDPSLKPYAYNPDQAKKLLAEAGYANGFDTTLTIYTADTAQFEAIISYWQQVGVRAKLVNMEVTAYLSALRTRKLHGLSSMGYSSGLTGIDGTNLWDSYFKTDQQYSNYSNPEMDDVMAKQAETTDQAKRVETLRRVNRFVYDELPVLPTFYSDTLWGVGPKVQDIRFIPGWVYLGGGTLETLQVK